MILFKFNIQELFDNILFISIHKYSKAGDVQKERPGGRLA